ncbi:MAG: hypothetical protein VYA38_03015 [Gemmatimonadota bacterium]|nr:hypothetical protein [Gemmatimonadota bacterium]
MSKRMAMVFLCVTVALGVVSTAAAQDRASEAEWEVPRTPDGRPDLQGIWTNQSMTPTQRRGDQGPVYTPEEVAEIERGYADREASAAQASDPNRPPPERKNTISVADSYNDVYFQRGNGVAVVYGEPRTSLITVPSNGRIPPRTPEARERRAESREARGQFGQYDHPELRPLAERCLTSYGSPAGPPMLPTGLYNSNYIIVQTPDHVLIMTEMVHDARIIRIGDGPKLPPNIRPWMGDSWGHWEGDVLVVETTNIHPLQPYSSAEMKVTERFSRMREDAVLYEFMVDDPSTYAEPWGGQIPMTTMPDQMYEYACQEGNYALSAVLSGARYQERMEAEEANDSRRD